MSKLRYVGILLVFAMMFSVIAPVIPVQAATDPSGWYTTVPGVLDSDYYVLYPYEKNSLTIGFSKFGEMINSNDNTGLQFGGVDPFAPPAGSDIDSIMKNRWLQGWFINITYLHRIQGARNVWACALFSDGIEYGRDWLRVDFMADKDTTYGQEDPRDPGYLISGSPYPGTLMYGGRKTNGTTITQDIKVLYDGPREFIGETRTTVKDHFLFRDNNMEGDVPLVQVVLTFVFDKVKKEVNVLKDVKSLLPLKEGEKMKIEFSNRGEVDLGTPATNYASYAHFYTDGVWSKPGAVLNDTIAEGYPTVYNSAWELIKTEDPPDPEYPGFSAAGPYPQDVDATVDVAQCINSQGGYVWYAAFWPSTSDWSIDGWENWWHSLHVADAHYVDLRPTIGEPSIPFYIGEWDFVLYYDGDPEVRTQFRGVTQYGCMYRHDAQDTDHANGNVIDREVTFFLDQAFNPWDLEKAVHKKTQRWLEWDNNGGSFTTTHYPVIQVPTSEWDQYGVFSERLIDMVTGQLLNRWEGDYSVSYDSLGRATYSGLPAHKIKVLYSVLPEVTLTAPLTIYTNSFSGNFTGDPASTPITISNFDTTSDYESFTDKLQTDHELGVEELFTTFAMDEPTADYSATIGTSNGDFYGYALDFKVFKGHTTWISWDNLMSPSLWENTANTYANVSIEGLDVHWKITAPDYRDIHVWQASYYANVAWTISYNLAERELNVTMSLVLSQFNPYSQYENVLYSASGLGQYEWVEVGRDSDPVDSAGASLVSAAFKNKQVEIGIAGLDMNNVDPTYQIPYIMSKFGAGTAYTDYLDAKGRAALNDDWCTTWPVASSNIIGVGGPFANVLSYYTNDFHSTLFGLPWLTPSGDFAGGLTGVPCWNRAWAVNGGKYNVYTNTATVGFATVATTIDLNGTEIFTIYGIDARDTFYATQWFYGDEARGIGPGIHELQRAPAGVTSMIIRISYSDAKHPTFSIVEVLGTKSERLWTDFGADDVTSPYKGGIHDP